MKTIEKNIILVSRDTYTAAKVATYLCQEFGFVLDEVIPEGETNTNPNVISIYGKVENITYTSDVDFIIYLDHYDTSDIIQTAHTVASEAADYYLREFKNKTFLSQ